MLYPLNVIHHHLFTGFILMQIKSNPNRDVIPGEYMGNMTFQSVTQAAWKKNSKYS